MMIDSDKQTRITDMSDSDFISFLFSERDRENNLSTIHGWNNWALLGAIITVLCTAYAIIRNNNNIEVKTVVYNTTCLWAYFLACHSWTWIFRRERGFDFSKVRMMKEVLPVVKIVFVFISAILLSIVVYVYDRNSIIFLLSITIIILYSIAVSVSLCHKNKIVPIYYKDMILPWLWLNIIFEAVIGGLYGYIGEESFELARNTITTADFELAACIFGVIVLLFYLFKLNFENKVIRRFDAIMDKYFYAGASKEETFHEISKNRMGYGVLDACYKELHSVEAQTELCVAEGNELREIKETVLSGHLDLARLQQLRDRVDVILSNQQEALDLSKILLDRMNEIVKVSSVYKNISDIDIIFNKNHLCYERVMIVIEEVGDVAQIINEAEIEFFQV